MAVNNLNNPIVQAMLENAYNNANPEMMKMITEMVNKPTRGEFLNQPFGGDIRGVIATNPQNNRKVEAPPLRPEVPFSDEDTFVDNPISLAYEDANPMPRTPFREKGFMGPEITSDDLSKARYEAMGDEQFNPYTGVSNYEYYRQGGNMDDFMIDMNRDKRGAKFNEFVGGAKDWAGGVYDKAKGLFGNILNKKGSESTPSGINAEELLKAQALAREEDNEPAWINEGYGTTDSPVVDNKESFDPTARQKELISAGYQSDLGPSGADGVWGPLSKAAWDKYQTGGSKFDSSYAPEKTGKEFVNPLSQGFKYNSLESSGLSAQQYDDLVNSRQNYKEEPVLDSPVSKALTRENLASAINDPANAGLFNEGTISAVEGSENAYNPNAFNEFLINQSATGSGMPFSSGLQYQGGGVKFGKR